MFYCNSTDTLINFMACELENYYTICPSKISEFEALKNNIQDMCSLCEVELQDIKSGFPYCDHIRSVPKLTSNNFYDFTSKDISYWKQSNVSNDELSQFYMFIVKKIVEYKKTLAIMNKILLGPLKIATEPKLNNYPLLPSEDCINTWRCQKRN